MVRCFDSPGKVKAEAQAQSGNLTDGLAAGHRRSALSGGVLDEDFGWGENDEATNVPAR